ncbi:MAG: hypothetical protein JKP90_17455 [Desulfofustis sp. PB-SRB1]|nr:hypothetical protein [Desulfofustis sp. PB-SRB1]
MGSTAENFQLGTKRMTEDQLADYQKNQPGTFIVWHFLDESNPDDLALLDKSILHPRILIESDEMFWMYMDDHDRIINYEGDAWPLPEGTFSHPRSNGTFAKILRSYVRERKLMTMQEALRKMSLMPAQTIERFVPQMKKKGRLQEGMDADIVVFDPETIRDVGTYEKNPTNPARANTAGQWRGHREQRQVGARCQRRPADPAGRPEVTRAKMPVMIARGLTRTITLLLLVGWLLPGLAAGEEAREVTWADLLPKDPVAFDDPFEQLSADQLRDLAMVARIRSLIENGKSDTDGPNAAEEKQLVAKLEGEASTSTGCSRSASAWPGCGSSGPRRSMTASTGRTSGFRATASRSWSRRGE